MANSRTRQFERRYRYYEILEVSRNATQEEIRRAYIRLAKQHHPDVNPDKDAHEKFKKINEAYQILSDASQRASYDNSPAECPVCWTHEVIQTVETHWRCRHCGCRFDPSRVSEVIEQVEKATIPERLRRVLRIFQTTQCSSCRKFYTQPFLCPYGRLQSNCISFDRLGEEEKRRFLEDEKWWWRIADMLQHVQDKGIMGKCRDCGALNPNPQKTNCWKCGRDTLCCPGCPEAPILRYNIEEDFWKCPNAAHGKKYAIRPKKKAVEPALTEEICPHCGRNLYYDAEMLLWRCRNCKRIYTYDDLRKRPTGQMAERSEPTGKADKRGKKAYGHRIQNWVVALLLIFALSIAGLGIGMFAGSFIPFWLMFGFSLIYSVEKWFYYFTRKYKGLGKLYRLLLNLSILSLVGLLVWSGMSLFSHQFTQSSLVGSLIFLGEFVFFIWMWRVVAKNSWRWPSMKLTVFSLSVLFVVLAFAGVQPMSDYKDSLLTKISGSGCTPTTTMPTPAPAVGSTSSLPSATSAPPAAPSLSDKIDPKTGQYKNYYLGLVKNPEVEGGSGCYDVEDKFVILINNQNAKNPTYSELVNFLLSNKTDEFPYQLSLVPIRFYYGQAEDNINLAHIQDIIDGKAQPSPPRVCADFAERLHNEAEIAGIRCGYVVIDNLSHALNVFETTDRGLVFIDDTGKSSDFRTFTIALPTSVTFGEPKSWDKVAYLEVGKPYGLISLECASYFGLDYSGYEKWLMTKKELDTLRAEYDRLAGGRLLVPPEVYYQLQNILAQEKILTEKLGGFWDSLGTVTSYYVTWDGNWKNRK